VGEDCDSADLGGATCADFAGLGGGTLACSDVCALRTNGCALAACGDGILSIGEGCDDGNVANADGCSATCTVE
jgi:cysteine-rich repeat protein